MKSLADLSRRLALIEGKRRHRTVVMCCSRSAADLPVYGMRGAGPRSEDVWERQPGESVESLHERAKAGVGDGRFGFFTIYEVGPAVIGPPNWQENA